jgi:DNA modification methylase/ParB-like chromosome segregation protein Spo0J
MITPLAATVAIADIIIPPNRQRKEVSPDAVEELRNSLTDVGLLNAIVVREVEGRLVLVAGETRLRTMESIYSFGGTVSYNGQVLPEGHIPYTTLGQLTQLQAEEAELDENIRRTELPWQDRADALARLHALRVAQGQAAIEAAIASGGPVPAPRTVADTAKEVTGRSDGYFQDSVRKQLLVAKHLDNPEVAKAKTVDDAFKVLKKQEEREKYNRLAAEVGGSLKAESHTLLQGDCVELMTREEFTGRFDVILTDPPYGMGADTFGDGAGKKANSEHQYDDSPESFKKLLQAWIPLTYKVTKPQAHLYLFCDIQHFDWLKKELQAAGWQVFRTPLISHKINSGRVPLPEHGPRRQYELILYAFKGNRKTNGIFSDVISAQADANMTHGAQKPVAVWADLLARSVLPGNEILDPFGGSGGTIIAGHQAKCRVTYMEKFPEYYAMGVKRVQSLKTLDDFPAAPY